MPRVVEGVSPSISSSNKIAPVEIDPPPSEADLLAARALEGQGKSRDNLAPVDDQLGKFSSLEEIGKAGSLASENAAVGGGQANNSLQTASENNLSQGE